MKKYSSLLFILLFVSLSVIGCEKKSNPTTDTTTLSLETVVTTTTSSEEAATTKTEQEEILRATPDWVDKAIIYEVNIRQYTKEGTFEAFSEHLDRIKELGVNTLWFMPVSPISETNRKGTLGSYYSISDYTAINPEFGTMEEFKSLVNKAQDLGFRVVIDWVANHTGWDSAWITDHPEWYLHNAAGEIVHPPGTDWDDVAQLNFENQELRRAMIDAMKFWVEEINVDGFRCDYAVGVPLDFWETARKELTTIKEIYMLAEDDQSKAFLINAFDSNYNWKFFKNVNSVAKGNAKASSIRNNINVNNSFPAGSFPLNFIDNHDENSWNGTIESRMGKEPINAITTLLFTMPGVPLVYSGQEAGLNKSLAFFEKDEINWSSFPYEAIIRTLSDIKTSNPALHNGSFGGKLQYLDEDNRNIIAFQRTKDSNTITVIINLSNQPQQLTADLSELLDSKILIHGKSQDDFSTEGTTVTTEFLSTMEQLSPWEYIVITN